MSDRVGVGFPAGFSFGAATAAYQIEGAWDADGKGPSVWDTLAHQPPGFADGATGDRACDHYHRFHDDVELMSRLGVDSYRFSVSWPRVQPSGRGRWNPAGVAFYQRLVDRLLTHGIEPVVTLYHWDHPQALEDEGGWMRREMAAAFADYAAGMAERFGDRVHRWITLNEPLSVLTGNLLGFSRPAGALGRAGLAVAHHQLLAHGLAVARLRELLPNSEVGITLNFTGFEPGSDHPADLDAAERARIYEDRLFLDPLLRGGYPLLEGHPVIDASEDDLATIAAPIDFLGVNWYGPSRVVHPWHRPRRGEAGGPPAADLAQLFDGHADLFGYARVPIPDAPTTVMGWPVLPDRFGEVLGWLRRDYPSLPPVYITENGLPCLDRVDADGAVHDAVRIEYLSGCLRQLAAAIADGMDIRGYYVWSLLDNLEWGLGYRPRFGLVHVDFDTLQRSPKDSFYWYRDVISAHRSRAGAVDHSTAVGE